MNDTDYLRATPFVDSDEPAIRAFADKATRGADTAKQKALALYGAVRDSIQYDPYVDFLDPAKFRASAVLHAARGSVSANRQCLPPPRAGSASPHVRVMPTYAITSRPSG